MAGMIADVLILVPFIFIALQLLTTLDRVFAIPYFRPSRQEGRDLFVAPGAAGSTRPAGLEKQVADS